jgi:hypothetical protein
LALGVGWPGLREYRSLGVSPRPMDRLRRWDAHRARHRLTATVSDIRIRDNPIWRLGMNHPTNVQTAQRWWG